MCEYEHGCVRRAADNGHELCTFHYDTLIEAKEDAQVDSYEARMDAEKMREYPKGYDGR